jgi:hypothetical protein
MLAGFAAKAGFDYYHDFINRQERIMAEMAKMDAKWELIDKAKEDKI